jgi:hypothetical protein
MTSQAIEGTGMTLAMSGGWTSDITEMTLPYSVRQAIDDTHLGDTMIRWVPSKKIEHGTMAIRFWHDPARQLPITGDPEMMVITYPDGINHLTVVGFVEKIGKESIKVGELMQTDALVRVIDYPKAAAVPSGSFPMWTAALTCKVVTDIIETATLRYFIDSSANPVVDIIATNSPSSGFNLVGNPGGASKNGTIFGKAAIKLSEYPASYMYYATGTHVSSLFAIDEFTICGVLRYAEVLNRTYLDHFGNANAVYSGSIGTGLSVTRDANPPFYKGVRLYRGYTQLTLATVPLPGTEMLAVARCKGGTWRIYTNGVETTGSYTPGVVSAGSIIKFGRYTNSNPNLAHVRDWAFWNYALSDDDFLTLNDQLCAEYGIT